MAAAVQVPGRTWGVHDLALRPQTRVASPDGRRAGNTVGACGDATGKKCHPEKPSPSSLPSSLGGGGSWLL